MAFNITEKTKSEDIGQVLAQYKKGGRRLQLSPEFTIALAKHFKGQKLETRVYAKKIGISTERLRYHIRRGKIMEGQQIKGQPIEGKI